jgi:hypothetical protein
MTGARFIDRWTSVRDKQATEPPSPRPAAALNKGRVPLSLPLPPSGPSATLRRPSGPTTLTATDAALGLARFSTQAWCQLTRAGTGGRRDRQKIDLKPKGQTSERTTARWAAVGRGEKKEKNLLARVTAHLFSTGGGWWEGTAVF